MVAPIVVVALTLLTNPVLAMIPFYAHDWECEIYGSDGTALRPYVAQLIIDNATLYGENGWNGGDAYWLEENGATANVDYHDMFYIGATNLNYAGFPAVIAAGAGALENERNFYHSTDPSSLVAWWIDSDSVEVHWDWDLRFSKVPASSEEPNNMVTATKYKVRWFNSSGVETVYDIVNDATVLRKDDVDPALHYSCIVETYKSDSEIYLEFTPEDEPVVVSSSDGPHFWHIKTQMQESAYHDLDGSTTFDFEIRFGVDGSYDSQNVEIDIWRAYGSDILEENWVIQPIPNGSIDFGTEIVATISTSVNEMLKYGGIAYRLTYNDPTNGTTLLPSDIPAPQPEDPPRKRFFWSSINNRVMGCSWKTYFMNIAGADWRNTFKAVADEVHSGVQFGNTPPHAYDYIFMDSILGALKKKVGATHNSVRPYEYEREYSYYVDTKEFVKAVNQDGGPQYYLNTTYLRLVSDTADQEEYPRVAGYMVEEIPNSYIYLTTALLRSMWRVHEFPNHTVLFKDNIEKVIESGDDTVLDQRFQTLACYLLSMNNYTEDGQPVGNTPLLGYGRWLEDGKGDNVNIMPEQLLNIGRPDDVVPHMGWENVGPENVSVGDVATLDFVVTQFNWEDGTPEDHIIQTGSLNHHFFTRTFDLLDSCGQPCARMYVAMDVEFDEGPVSFTPGELFGADRQLYYRLCLEDQFVTVTEGGTLWTAERKVNENDWLTDNNSIVIYFDREIFSPKMQIGYTVYDMPGDPAISPRLAIKAWHWNNEPVEVRVDASAIGWSDDILLNDNQQNGDLFAADSIYTYSEGPVTVGKGTYPIPVVLTGTDGLKYYGTSYARVTEPPSIALVGKSQWTDELYNLDGDLVPLSSAALDYDGDGQEDLFITYEEGHSATEPEYGRLMRWHGHNGSVPKFEDRTQYDIDDFFDMPSSQTCIAPADFDNDGDLDIFIGHESTPILLEWDEAENKYYNRISTLMNVLPDKSYSAIWVDYYNGVDDDDNPLPPALDLIVARADGPPQRAHEEGRYGQYPYVFKGQPNKTYPLRFITPDSLPFGMRMSYDVIWSYVNDDRLPDIYFSDIATEQPSGLWINDGQGSFVNGNSTWFDGNPPEDVRSALFIDINDDHRQDLVVARWYGEDNLGLYTNESGSFVATDKSVRNVPTEPANLSGLAKADFDLNGQIDLVVTPQRGSQSPYLLLNGLGGTAGEFSRYCSLTLGQGLAQGATIADWGIDGWGRRSRHLPGQAEFGGVLLRKPIDRRSADT